MKNFWLKWRREIIRGGVLFAIVVTCGLWIAGNVRAGRDRLINGMSDRFGPFNGDFNDAGREHAVAFEWHGPVTKAQTVWVRNMNGGITVERGSGSQVEVSAEKSWRRSPSDSVRVVTIPDSAGLTICALWGSESACEARGRYNVRKPHRVDVAMQLTVRVPAGVAVDASTISGPLQVTNVSGDVKLEVVNGRIRISGATGAVQAQTVNGGVDLALDALSTRGVDAQTVNGGITVTLPARVNADVDAAAVMGRVSTDFPIQMTGALDTKHVRGRIGTGGSRLHLETVHGGISISQAPGGSIPPPAGAPAPSVPPKPGSAPRPAQPR
jgi:putative adhesin